MLRPRFRPGWVGSWKMEGATRISLECEDGWTVKHFQLMDAVRIKDGFAVGLKRLVKEHNPNGAEILAFFSSEPLVNDPKPCWKFFTHLHTQTSNSLFCRSCDVTTSHILIQ
ncbi:hypothetical protein DFH09DRAFT_1176308 [Mycena vulgaris]|nr:hypothetical protein DFH09DRAFT_1176308 [Mycena vulgaris]